MLLGVGGDEGLGLWDEVGEVRVHAVSTTVTSNNTLATRPVTYRM
jgi:hypothetical protein